MPRIPPSIRQLAAAARYLDAERDEEGNLLDPEGVAREAEAILAYEGTDDEGEEEQAPVEESAGAVGHGDMPHTRPPL